MKHRDIRLEEYLRGELSSAETARVREHLTACPSCRQQAAWLERLHELVRRVHSEPPDEVVAELNRRLLPVPRHPARKDKPGTWARIPTFQPLLRAAALLLVGMALGWTAHEVRPGAPATFQPLAVQRDAPTSEPISRTLALGGRETLRHPRDMESVITSLYLARVEATLIGFLTAASRGAIEAPEVTALDDLLSTTANLKADCKTTDDTRMARLLGQIESVLIEMDRLQRERDLPGARHVASLIEEQGLLSTLHRIKIEVEE